MVKIGAGFGFSIAALILLLGIQGCSDNSSSPPQADPQKAKERVSQANQIFIPKLALIFLSQGTDTSAYDMSAAKSLYGEALPADPGNLDAHFGFALTEILLLNKDPRVRALVGGLRSPAARTLPEMSFLNQGPSARQILTSVIGERLLSYTAGSFPQSPQNLYGDIQKSASAAPF